MDEQWIYYKDQLPEIGKPVLFCCQIEDYFTDVEVGWYTGHKTAGNAIVMEYDDSDDWYPCTHWMPLPNPPEIETKK